MSILKLLSICGSAVTAILGCSMVTIFLINEPSSWSTALQAVLFYLVAPLVVFMCSVYFAIKMIEGAIVPIIFGCIAIVLQNIIFFFINVAWLDGGFNVVWSAANIIRIGMAVAALFTLIMSLALNDERGKKMLMQK